MTLGKSPVERVGKAVLPQVGNEILINLKGGEVGYSIHALDTEFLVFLARIDRSDLRDWVMASSENASRVDGS